MAQSPPAPPPDDNLPKGEDLWRILHDPGETEAPPETPTAAPPAESPHKVYPVPGPATRPRSAPPAARPPAAPGPAAPAPPDRDGEEASRIQRIISAPELLEPDFDYRDLSPAAPAAGDDFDAALRHFYRESGISIKCRNHADEEAAGQCPECQAYYCQSCLVVRRGRMVCRDCAAALFVPSEEQVISAQIQGLEADAAEIAPQEHPEFQIGGTLFGVEGRPAHPLKKLLALALDLLLVHGGLMLALFILSTVYPHSQSPLLQVFAGDSRQEVFSQALNAALWFNPPLPWLIVFVAADYLYFFFSLAVANRTFGMSWLGCRVVTEWGDFVSPGAVLVRTLVFMVCLGWPAILIGWFFPAYRGPHDYAGGTLVINYDGIKRVDAYETIQIKL